MLAAPYASNAQTSISPKRWPPNCALPPSGCCVIRLYGPIERPHLHLSEALSAKLRLAAEWLLRDQAVWSNRASVNLVVDQVRQLQHVDVSDCHFLLERIATQTVVQHSLA